METIESNTIEKQSIVHSTEGTLPAIEKVVYTGKTHTTGGRDGASLSSDGRLDIKLAHPGSKRVGTNPEQLFAAGWSACFMSALGIAASQVKVSLPPDAAIDAEVDRSHEVVCTDRNRPGSICKVSLSPSRVAGGDVRDL